MLSLRTITAIRLSNDRWCSDHYLGYRRRQCSRFRQTEHTYSEGNAAVSRDMLKHNPHAPTMQVSVPIQGGSGALNNLVIPEVTAEVLNPRAAAGTRHYEVL